MASEIEFNRTIDLGSLAVFDTNNFQEAANEDDIVQRTRENLRFIYSELYKLKTTQIGNEEENRDYDKPTNAVILPAPTTILPRGKPIPKSHKTETKWEKFSKDKGIFKSKRSRMVYSEELGKYLPRWGKGSIKTEEEKAKWVIEDKPKYEGKNPFTYEKQERKLVGLKQSQRESKNEEFLHKKRDKDSKLKDDKKSQRKNLEIAQKSTASQGRFDRKLKEEPKINKLKGQKINKAVMLSSKEEKQRDSKILSKIMGK